MIPSLPIQWRTRVFHPLTVVGVSLTAALIFAVLIIMRFGGDQRTWILYYCLPIGIPFVGYLFDRASRWREHHFGRWGIDVIVVSLSVMRAGLFMIPLISGHALFLTYAILTTHMWVVRLMAIGVMIQVIYLKVFAWHDITIFGGSILGCLAAWGFHHIRRQKQPFRIS
jgi:hypothetical protein